LKRCSSTYFVKSTFYLNHLKVTIEQCNKNIILHLLDNDCISSSHINNICLRFGLLFFIQRSLTDYNLYLWFIRLIVNLEFLFHVCFLVMLLEIYVSCCCCFCLQREYLNLFLFLFYLLPFFKFFPSLSLSPF